MLIRDHDPFPVHFTAIYWPLLEQAYTRGTSSVKGLGMVPSVGRAWRAVWGSPLTLPFHCRLSRVLYGNKITDLPQGVFGGLFTLQLL